MKLGASASSHASRVSHSTASPSAARSRGTRSIATRSASSVANVAKAPQAAERAQTAERAVTRPRAHVETNLPDFGTAVIRNRHCNAEFSTVGAGSGLAVGKWRWHQWQCYALFYDFLLLESFPRGWGRHRPQDSKKALSSDPGALRAQDALSGRRGGAPRACVAPPCSWQLEASAGERVHNPLHPARCRLPRGGRCADRVHGRAARTSRRAGHPAPAAV